MSTELDREWIALWNYAHKRRSRFTEQRIERLIRADADEQLNAAVSRATGQALAAEMESARLRARLTEARQLLTRGINTIGDDISQWDWRRDVEAALAESPSKVEQ